MDSEQTKAFDDIIYQRLLTFNRVMDTAQKQVELQNAVIDTNAVEYFWKSLFHDIDFVKGILINKN